MKLRWVLFFITQKEVDVMSRIRQVKDIYKSIMNAELQAKLNYDLSDRKSIGKSKAKKNIILNQSKK